MTELSKIAIAQTIAKSARDNLGVDIDMNSADGMEALAAALFNQADVGRVQAFVADLIAAGIEWDKFSPAEARPKMTYRVYELPIEVGSAIYDDEPSIGMYVDAAKR